MMQLASLIGILAVGMAVHWLVRRATQGKRDAVETLERSPAPFTRRALWNEARRA